MAGLEKIIVDRLYELSDEKYKEFHSGLCPGTDNILGVRVPVLRNFAKEILKKYPVIDILKIGNTYYEETMLKGMVIGLQKEKDICKVMKQIEEFVPLIDNWGVCDVFVGGLKVVKRNKEIFWDFIQRFLQSGKEFQIRFGIVVMLSYYIEEKYIGGVFERIDRITHNGYYVKMAAAWAISVCLVKFYDETCEYLKNSKIDKFTYNKSLQKAIESYRITDMQKEALKALKKR